MFYCMSVENLLCSGNVRALLVRGNKSYRLSKDHSPSNTKERDRVIREGNLFLLLHKSLSVYLSVSLLQFKPFMYLCVSILLPFTCSMFTYGIFVWSLVFILKNAKKKEEKRSCLWWHHVFKSRDQPALLPLSLRRKVERGSAMYCCNNRKKRELKTMYNTLLPMSAVKLFFHVQICWIAAPFSFPFYLYAIICETYGTFSFKNNMQNNQTNSQTNNPWPNV